MIEDMMALLKDERDMDAITLEDAVPGTQVDLEDAVPGTGVDLEDAVPGTGVDLEDAVPGAEVDLEDAVPGTEVDLEDAVPGTEVDLEDAVPGKEVDLENAFRPVQTSPLAQLNKSKTGRHSLKYRSLLPVKWSHWKGTQDAEDDAVLVEVVLELEDTVPGIEIKLKDTVPDI
jgi:hypothetical protein